MPPEPRCTTACDGDERSANCAHQAVDGAIENIVACGSIDVVVLIVASYANSPTVAILQFTLRNYDPMQRSLGVRPGVAPTKPVSRHSVVPLPSARAASLRTAAAATLVAPEVVSWAEVNTAVGGAPAGFVLRAGKKPSSAPSATLPTAKDSHLKSIKPVVVFRDGNAWCPYCERVSCRTYSASLSEVANCARCRGSSIGLLESQLASELRTKLEHAENLQHRQWL